MSRADYKKRKKYSNENNYKINIDDSEDELEIENHIEETLRDIDTTSALNTRKKEISFRSKNNNSFFLKILVIAVIIVIAAFIIVLAVKNSLTFDSEKGTAINSESSAETDVSEPSDNTDSIVADDNNTSQDNPDSTVTDNNETTSPLILPDTEDGTGQAGIKPLEEEMKNTSPGTGWQGNYYGKWYAPDENTCYYGGWKEIDGQKYHFDSYGHLDLGWKLIGGQSCYFDDNGVYIPDKDNSKLLAFTFDDGPSPNYDGILTLCKNYGARVTFFMIGDNVDRGGAAIPYLQNYRCQIGNHSYTHSNMDNLTPEECAADFQKCNESIVSFSVGIPADVLRFPYGNITPENEAAVYAPSIFWDIDTFDWQSQDANEIIKVVLDNITEGNIILMHDRYDATLEACEYLFPYLIEQGYSLVTVSELAAAKGVELQPGVTYYNFRGFDY